MCKADITVGLGLVLATVIVRVHPHRSSHNINILLFFSSKNDITTVYPSLRPVAQIRSSLATVCHDKSAKSVLLVIVARHNRFND